MTDRITDIWGTRTPHARGTRWPVRVDAALEDGLTSEDVDRWVQSACVLCSNGCACDIAVKDGRMVGVRGRAVDTVNHGRLGPKGLFGSWQGMNGRHGGGGRDTDRLTRPLIREDGRLVETDWATAMGRVVERSRSLLTERGPLTHGFYTSGQLFLEEYYTLAMIGKAALGTPHMDGNTRLCTATAAASMKESFGCDGQPGSYEDIDECDAIFLWGHNMAETQTVLWTRVLDRLDGPDPPAVVCVDPRRTPVARRADLHIAPLNGTNQALMNGILREVVHRGWVDHDYVAAHTRGYESLLETVDPWTPERTAETCGVNTADIHRAAAIFGTTDRVLSTVLQGFYQSHQATAASCQVNNLHLLRGMIGRPGAGVLQMNGQPTAENTRECGADGDLSGFRNWNNLDHIEELARLWNVDPLRIPHWAPPTHAMQIFRYAEQGSIGLLWINATNPAVSLPELDRVRRILSGEQCFVVVQDLYLTETAQLADVVLPAAGWGEKTGTFTNADRTVHLSDKAVEPPGEARSDLDIFLDYARRMDFRDNDGRPLPPWNDPEEAFDAWRECTRGKLCDYTGITYHRLRGGSGIPWPCNEEAPDGTVRLYGDGVFPTSADVAETYGHDLLTGAAVSPTAYRSRDPGGRALLKTVDYLPPFEQPSGWFPLRYTTGRTVYHFHTRTKTGRAPKLHGAAPDAWVELSRADADDLGIAEGDRVRMVSRRGSITVTARVTGGRPGVVFVPFHYGEQDREGEPPRAANELTMTEWDPVSKQPFFKVAAVRIERVGPGEGTSPAPATAGSVPADPRGEGGTDAEAHEEVTPVEPPSAATRELE